MSDPAKYHGHALRSQDTTTVLEVNYADENPLWTRESTISLYSTQIQTGQVIKLTGRVLQGV